MDNENAILIVHGFDNDNISGLVLIKSPRML